MGWWGSEPSPAGLLSAVVRGERAPPKLRWGGPLGSALAELHGSKSHDYALEVL